MTKDWPVKWQVLETKGRFINQVMNGSVTVRQAEDLEGGALTYAEIKAIASGNPAVMEKVRVDTEIRKLDQLRASHINQQHNIRWQVKSLPEQIARAQKYHAAVSADVVTRDATADQDFAMTIGNRVYTGKGAREDAGSALAAVVLSWRDDLTAKVRGSFRGFEILIYTNRAIVLFALRRYDDALASCENAIAVEPDHPNAYCTQSAVYRALKQYPEALAGYRKLLAAAKKKAGNLPLAYWELQTYNGSL